MLYREPARTPQANAGVRARSPRVGGTRGSYPILVFLVCLSAAPAGHAAAGCPNVGAFRTAGDRPAPCLVRAVGAVGGRRSLATAPGRATIAAPTRPVRRAPAAPSHLTARAAATSVRLHWRATPGGGRVVAFRVYRGASAIARVGRTRRGYTDRRVRPGRSYRYTVRALGRG